MNQRTKHDNAKTSMGNIDIMFGSIPTLSISYSFILIKYDNISEI